MNNSSRDQKKWKQSNHPTTYNKQEIFPLGLISIIRRQDPIILMGWRDASHDWWLSFSPPLNPHIPKKNGISKNSNVFLIHHSSKKAIGRKKMMFDMLANNTSKT